METPLHFDGGLFSDITTADGSKLLSKVTVDKVSNTSRHDVTGSPAHFEHLSPQGKDLVDSLTRSETFTNEDVIRVKFTPVPSDVELPRSRTPSVNRPTPVLYIKDDLQDLQSYKIVNTICKENNLDANLREKSTDSLDLKVNSSPRPRSPLADYTVPEQMTKIETYLQRSLEICSGNKTPDFTSVTTLSPDNNIKGETVRNHETLNIKSASNETTFKYFDKKHNDDANKVNSYHENEKSSTYMTESQNDFVYDKKLKETKKKNVDKCNEGVLSAIYNMPIHYHSMILCFILIVYNLIHQYLKKNCH